MPKNIKNGTFPDFFFVCVCVCVCVCPSVCRDEIRGIWCYTNIVSKKYEKTLSEYPFNFSGWVSGEAKNCFISPNYWNISEI